VCQWWRLIGLVAALVLAGQPRARADFVFTGPNIPGMGTPTLLLGLAPTDAAAKIMEPEWSINGSKITLNTGDTWGTHVLHFALNLNGTALPVNLDSLFAPDVPPPTQKSISQQMEHVTGSFLAGNSALGEFNVHFDLAAPGGVGFLDGTYPKAQPGFDLAGELRFKPLGGHDPVFTVEVFNGNTPLDFTGPAAGGSGVSEAPEPGTLTLLGTGLLGLLGYRWRRRGAARG
jgi:hypothetical protein